MAELRLENISKSYGETAVIRSANIHVAAGEFVTLLGPSGCGKSTTLSMIAGLTAPTSGRIVFDGKVIADPSQGIFVEPEHRDFGVVFQSYALWPHLTVRENLEFPLKIRKVSPIERRRRIDETVELVGLGGLADRYPAQLSGGQQQRVGLARALVYRPALLLLDEPLSNLDAILREQARVWLKDVQARLGVTTIYVTHDQTEALSMSDRIVVMNRGDIVQDAPPQTIYENPTALFVAEFVGSSNFINGRVIGSTDERVRIAVTETETLEIVSNEKFPPGTSVTISVRPEHIVLSAAGPSGGTNLLRANLKRNRYEGERYVLECDAGNQPIRVYSRSPHEHPSLTLCIDPARARIFPAAA